MCANGVYNNNLENYLERLFLIFFHVNMKMRRMYLKKQIIIFQKEILILYEPGQWYHR